MEFNWKSRFWLGELCLLSLFSSIVAAEVQPCPDRATLTDDGKCSDTAGHRKGSRPRKT